MLPLTRNEVSPDDLEACHRVKKKENVIIKFKSRKLRYKIINNEKIMKKKSKKLKGLEFSNNLYISESMCAGNHGLLFKSGKLKKAREIFNTLFFNNSINYFRKTHRFLLISNVLLGLFNLQLCLLFFLKTMKLYNNICSA